jgi:arginyl-tRNA--protein-N-Asp/Glu arginylyltransferase
MSSPKELPLQALQFYVTTPYTCGYIAKNLAQSLIASPHHLVDATAYGHLISQGFRRSGKFTYRPHCENCIKCVPVRIVLDLFTPTRSQKRAYKQHNNLIATVLPLGFHQAHYELYSAYQALRHTTENDINQNRDTSEEDQYKQFLCQSNVKSILVEFRDAQDQVKIVSVIDTVADGNSAVYTFYDATETKASYGTYAIMWLINWTKQRSLPYLYLGYWIAESQKMAYKEKFTPQERFINNEWISSIENNHATKGTAS